MDNSDAGHFAEILSREYSKVNSPQVPTLSHL